MLHLPFLHHQNRGDLVLGHVIPFNVLATQAEHPYDIAAAVLEAFRRTWPECLKEAPHFSNVVTAALIVLIENGLTLMHMPRLLTNPEFREQCLERVTDASIVEFFSGVPPRSPSATATTAGGGKRP